MRTHENHRTPVKCAFHVRLGTEILPCSMAQKFPWIWAQRYRSVPAEHISMTSGLPRPLLLHQTCWMLMTDMTEPMCLWRSHPMSHICRFSTESASGRLVSFHRIWTDQLVPLQRECLLFPAHARPSRSSCDGELTDLCLLYTRVRGVLWRRSLLRMDTDVVRRCWHPAADQQRCVSCCRPNAVHMLRAAMRSTSHRCVAPLPPAAVPCHCCHRSSIIIIIIIVFK